MEWLSACLIFIFDFYGLSLNDFFLTLLLNYTKRDPFHSAIFFSNEIKVKKFTILETYFHL